VTLEKDRQGDVIDVREYGAGRDVVVLLHGGPGAPGHMAPVARDLAGYRVLEPLQRGSGAVPLTVQTHIDDLRDVLCSPRGHQAPVHLVGSSWGAMLALAFAADHPAHVRSIVLVGCGTFDEATRASFKRNLDARLGAVTKNRLQILDAEIVDQDQRLRARVALLMTAYMHEPITSDLGLENTDARANEETWRDMLRLQAAGVYPAAFRRIPAPVLMIHGVDDPHPGRAIHASLLPYLPQIEYRELSRCGHYPWLERHARAEFFRDLLEWFRHARK
jgi:pimeloyl-ACP methyl ester carboxylesterase